jgi:hypothetical protein
MTQWHKIIFKNNTECICPPPESMYAQMRGLNQSMPQYGEGFCKILLAIWATWFIFIVLHVSLGLRFLSQNLEAFDTCHSMIRIHKHVHYTSFIPSINVEMSSVTESFETWSLHRFLAYKLKILCTPFIIPSWALHHYAVFVTSVIRLPLNPICVSERGLVRAPPEVPLTFHITSA